MLKIISLYVMVLFWALPLLSIAEVSYIGSSTIGDNIIPEAAESFEKTTKIKFGKIDVPGSGKGIKAVMSGQRSLAGASRPLKRLEKKNLLYQIIGYDAIGIYVNEKNPVTNLTQEQVKAIFTGKIKNWKEVGGQDAPIVCITETWGELRATMVEFNKLAMDSAPYSETRTEVDRPLDQAELLKKEIHGIANVSVVYARPGIKLLSINDSYPNIKNIQSALYPFSRPLLLITKGLPQGDIKKFIDFMLSKKGQGIVGKKFVPVK